MPANFTPIETIDRPHTIGGGNDGSAGGRRPPEDTKHTGGGGEGDDFHHRSEGHRGPRENLHRHRIALFSALIGDAMFFVALIGVFLISKTTYHIDAHNQLVNEWRAIHVPSILWLNTFVLLLSSITFEIARRGMFHENEVLEEWLDLDRPVTRRVSPWLIATGILGSAFVAGQVVAWRQLAATHIFYTGQSKQSFYLLTGTHAAHVAVGLCAVLTCIVFLRSRRSIESRQVLIDCTAWYWHAMGIFWIALFVLLEWFQ